MNKLLIAVLAFFTCYQIANADVLFSTLGPDGEFYTENGWSITYEPGNGGQAVAFGFEPEADATLESVELPVGFEWLPDGASAEFSVGIYEDVAGAPGLLLASASGTASYYWNSPLVELIQIDFPDSVELYSGMRYWVGVHPRDPVPTYLAWLWRYQALEAPLVEFWGAHNLSELLVGGTFDYKDTNWEAAFRVNGLTSKQSGKKEKQLICHVGNEAGPNGETYQDNPECVPSDLNDYFCPDAGKIDLIVVPKHAKHIGNPSHSWDGISDYLPEDVGASGEGTEDSDGNGIDDGCEPIDVCPCWDLPELQSVTADNLYRDLSCSFWSYDYPTTVWLFNLEELEEGVMTQFGATDGAPYGQEQNRCYASDGLGVGADRIVELTDQELAVCVNQIADRCAAIGDPITQ